MDVFSTAVTATTIIYNFLNACGDFSSDAKSLAARFKWDLVALKAVRNYFQQLQLQDAHVNLSQEHEQLLTATASYLDAFADDVQKSLKKIDREGWLKTTINRVMWESRRDDLEKMQAELQYWTDRFGIRVVTLPEEVRNVIPMAADSSNAPAAVASNRSLLDFTRLAAGSHQKTQRAREVFKDDTDLSRRVDQWGDISFIPIEDKGDQLIFATRRIPISVTPESARFGEIKSDVCELAAALHQLNPAANVRLLRIEYCFYHATSNQFLLAQKAPYAIISMMTLRQMISKSAFPRNKAALDERASLAHKLAEAVVFLHAAGYLHKNITSSSAVALRKARPTMGGKSSPSGNARPLRTPIDEVYLMGFDLVRSVESRTTKEGTEAISPEFGAGQNPVQHIWDHEIYMHPERLRGLASPKYQKTHDVYSLGVVLLEIGLWEPLCSALATAAKGAGLSRRDHPDTWPTKLKALAAAPGKLSARMGTRYLGVVEWCLKFEGDDGVKEIEFVQNVLDPLEGLAHASC